MQPIRVIHLMLAAVATFLISTSLFAEPPERPEIVGHFGALRYGADEGWDGSSKAFGGTLTIPISRRWAVEADVTTGERDAFDPLGVGRNSRRSIIAGHIQYRRGSEKVYWFAGFGPGYQFERNRGRALFQQPSDPGPVVRDFESTDNRFAPLGYKTGVVANPAGGLLIRGEVMMQHAYILPNAMFRFGVGWRF